jgi:outer membrane receptor protein involved in Fe transport
LRCLIPGRKVREPPVSRVSASPGAGSTLSRTAERAAAKQVAAQERVRWIVGTRVDWFGLLDKSVFSPHTTLLVKPWPRHTLRFSANRAFRAPSFLKSYIDLKFWVPLADGGVRVPAIAEGNLDLKEEALTAYEGG